MPRQRKYHTEADVRAAFAEPQHESRLERDVRLRKMHAVLSRVRRRGGPATPPRPAAGAWAYILPDPASDAALHAPGQHVKQEPEDEVDNDKDNEMYVELCSVIKKEEMEDGVDDDCVAYGEMQNEEVLSDSFPVPVGCPIRIEEKYEEDPSTLETFTVPATDTNNSAKVSDYILPDDGAVFPLFLSQQGEVLHTRTPHHIHGQQGTPTPNQESPTTPTSSLKKPSYQPSNKPNKSHFIDISPVSNENLSERAKEVLKRLARICPKVDKTTQNIVSKKGQNTLVELDVNTNMQTTVPSSNHLTPSPSQVNQVSIRTEEVLSKSQDSFPLKAVCTPSQAQAWGSVVILGAVTGHPYSSHQSQNQMLTLGPMTVSTQQQETAPRMCPEKTSVQSQQELGPFMRVTTVPVPTHQGLSQITSIATEPTLVQQSQNQMLTLGPMTVSTQQQEAGPRMHLEKTSVQSQQELGPFMHVTTVPVPTHQGLSQITSVATEPALVQQGLGQIITVATDPSTTQQQSFNGMISIAAVPPHTEKKELSQIISVVNESPATQQQGLNGMISVAAVPAQPKQQNLGPVLTIRTLTTPSRQQNLDSVKSLTSMHGQTHPQVVMGHAIALGAQTQEQRLGQFMPATATTHRGSSRLISIAPKPAQPKEGLGKLGSGETDLPRTQQQGLNQTISNATVPAQAKEKGLVSVMSMGAMSVPTSHQVIVPINSVQTDPQQRLHNAMPVETLTISAPLQAFGSILAKTPVPNVTATVPASGPLKVSTSASGSLQAPTWTSAALSIAPHLMRVGATKQEHGQAPAQVQTLTPVRARTLDPTVAPSPRLLPKVVQRIAPTPTQALTPTQAQAPVQTSVSTPASVKTPLLVEALSSALKGAVEPVRIGISNSTPASVQVSSPTRVQRSVPAASPISQEDLNLRLPVKMYKKCTKTENTKAPGPLLSEDSVSSSVLHQGAAGRLLRIALKDYSHLTEDNGSENTRTDQKTNVGK